MAGFGMILDAFRKGLSLSGSKWRTIFQELMKVNALSIIIVAVAVAIGAAFMLMGLRTDPSGIWISVAAAVFMIMVFVLVATAASSVSNNIIDGIVSGLEYGIIRDFKRNLLPVSAYSIILWLMMGIFAILPSSLVNMAGESIGSPLSYILARMASEIYYYAALFVIGFVFQFSLFELVVKRAGVLPSFGNSVGIVRRTFFETILFYIIGGIFSTLVQLVLLIPAAIIFLVPVVIGIIVAAAAANMTFNLVLLAIGVLYFIFILIAYTSAKLTVTLPINYYYWRMAR